ncbi:hypothetical protein KNT91_gp137 [Aeromonas phage 60AhydR15PP]|uniref:Uncharacterized protein n=1 Tax=Aeromonas phage 60AhydR15PP TaxID=2163979 RepID=A0A2S1PGF1_9CAUD|nr:hypothetical protein KNT91_gp137 [Aeromonas phage 60AhydR15PP]AWH15661.1 hypothetical protein [Aeromonas phage 60AhydR15PP]
MYEVKWIEINRDNHGVTFAMNTPNGVLIRVNYTFKSEKFDMTFIPDIKVVSNPNGNGYIFCHG